MRRYPIGLVCEDVGVERWVAGEVSGVSLLMRATHGDLLVKAGGYELRLSREETIKAIELLRAALELKAQ